MVCHRQQPARARTTLASSASCDWYACQDVDQSGLISMQEASDWQDLFCTRGKGLYVNCLYVLALRHAAEVARLQGDAGGAARYAERAAR